MNYINFYNLTVRAPSFWLTICIVASLALDCRLRRLLTDKYLLQDKFTPLQHQENFLNSQILSKSSIHSTDWVS